MPQSRRLPTALEELARSGFASTPALRVISELDAHGRRSLLVHLVERATRWRPFDDLFSGLHQDEQSAAQELGSVLDAFPDSGVWTLTEIRELLVPLALQDLRRVAGDAAWRLAFRIVRAADPLVQRGIEAEIEACVGAAERLDAGIVDLPLLTTLLDGLLPDPMPVDAVLVAISRQDPWGAAFRVALRGTDLDLHSLEAVIDLCRRAGRGRARDAWRDGVAVIVGRPASRRDIESIMEAATSTLAAYRPPADGSLPFSGDNELIAAGACSIFGLVAAASGAGRRRAHAIDRLETLLLWGGRWIGNRPCSNPVARASIDGLVSVGDERALAALHAAQERVGGRAGLTKPLMSAIDGLVQQIGKSAVEVTALALPSFGLDGAGRRTWTGSGGFVELVVEGDGVTVAVGGGISDTADVVVEARSVAAAIQKEIERLTVRIERSLRDRAALTGAEWSALTSGGPIHAAATVGLIWELRVDGVWRSVLRDAGGFRDASGTPVADTWESVRLWHPAAAAPDEVEAWRARVFTRRVRQPVRQAFREAYADLQEIPLGAPLRLRKAEAILRSRGWRVTGLGGWDGGQRARAVRVDPLTGAEAGLDIDATNPTNAGSAVGWCVIDPSRVTMPRATPDTAVFRSEVLRDLDLVVTAAGMTARTVARSDSAFRGLMASFAEQPLRGAGLLRHDVVLRLLGQSLPAEAIGVDDRFLIGKRSSLRIHLGNAVVVDDGGELRPLRTSGRTEGVPWLPFESDGLLAKMLAAALELGPRPRRPKP